MKYESDEAKARSVIANVLLMGLGVYDTPAAWADALMKRLSVEGLVIVRKDDKTVSA